MNKKVRIWSKLLPGWITDLSLENLTDVNLTLNETFVRNENIIYQWFVGAKDQNKKEIYEGDIITNDYVGELTPKLATVVWNKNSFIADCGSSMFNMAFTQKMIEGTVRIVGNIFENPELLK